jgi:hypothetical protein
VNVSTTAKKEADNGQMLYVLLLVWCFCLTTLLIIKGLVSLAASLFLLPTLRSAHFYLKAACYGCCHCHRQLLSSHDTSGDGKEVILLYENCWLCSCDSDGVK